MKVLVGYVDTPQGKAALEAGVAEARLRDAELIVTQHVPLTSDDQRGDEVLRVRDRLEALGEELRGDGLRCRTNWSIGPTSSARALLAYAEEEDPDLIVLGIRRRSPVGKALLGSDAQDIILRAHTAVLCVKAPADG